MNEKISEKNILDSINQGIGMIYFALEKASHLPIENRSEIIKRLETLPTEAQMMIEDLKPEKNKIKSEIEKSIRKTINPFYPSSQIPHRGRSV